MSNAFSEKKEKNRNSKIKMFSLNRFHHKSADLSIVLHLRTSYIQFYDIANEITLCFAPQNDFVSKLHSFFFAHNNLKHYLVVLLLPNAVAKEAVILSK